MPYLSSVDELAQAYEPRMPIDQLQQIIALAKRDPTLLEQLGMNPSFLTMELDKYKKVIIVWCVVIDP